jgi:hypothetical protein
MPPSGMADKLGNAGEACDTEPRARRVVVHRAIGIVTVARFCTRKLHAVVGISEILPVATIMRRLIVETEAQFAIADREENVLAASCRGVVSGHTIGRLPMRSLLTGEFNRSAQIKDRRWLRNPSRWMDSQ